MWDGLDPVDRALLDDWQRDLPVTPRPFAALGRAAGLGEDEVIDRLARLSRAGALARVGGTARPNTAGASTLAALAAPEHAVEQVAVLFCTSYVLSEATALVQSRLGMAQVRAFHEDIFPFLRVVWVDAALHHAGMTAVLAANRRGLSLVDCVTSAAMHQSGLNTVFASHYRTV